MTGSREARLSPARLASRSVTFFLLLLGALLAAVSSAQPWWRASGGGASVAFSGTEATGGLSQALAVVTLAGTLLVLVLKSVGRRLVAVLLAAAGVGLVVVGAGRLRPSTDAVEARLREVILLDSYALSPTAWPWLLAVAGLVVLGGAAALMVGAPRWLTTASRFERDRAQPARTAADDPAAIWRALDDGLDPTAPEVDPATPAVTSSAPGGSDPNVQFGDPGDTMVANSGTHQQDRGSQQSGRQESGSSPAASRPTSTPE